MVLNVPGVVYGNRDLLPVYVLAALEKVDVGLEKKRVGAKTTHELTSHHQSKYLE